MKIISRSIFCCLKIHHVEGHFISPYLKIITTHFINLSRNLYCSKCSSELWFLRKIGDLDHWLYSTVFSKSVTCIYSLLGCATYHLRFWLCELYREKKIVVHTLVMTCSITEQNVQYIHFKKTKFKCTKHTGNPFQLFIKFSGIKPWWSSKEEESF